MRDVADVTREEREPARRIDRLENNFRSWTQFVKSGLEKLDEVVGLEVLYDLCRKEATERSIGQ